MLIQINTDNQIPADSDRDAQLEERIRDRLARYEDRITRIEIHISDVDGPRDGADDKRASFEARINGRDPVAATDNAPTIERAVLGAADKAARAIERVFGKLTDRKGH